MSNHDVLNTTTESQGSAPGEPASPSAPGSGEGSRPEPGAVLDDVRTWLSGFILTMTPEDLDLLTLWAAHTHLAQETYTTPRLVIDSPVPGSGKTTVLEHLHRLCLDPVQMASLSSPALLTRMLAAGMRTLLIDEADRSLDPKKEGVPELLAVLNSGYKRGGTRPVLAPVPGGGWEPQELPTFSPVAMAGNNPRLPEDTRQRTIRVLLMPDLGGSVSESDWELLDDEAKALGARLAAWADEVREQVRAERPPLPEGITGRARERWSPLKRVAAAAGGHWPDAVDRMALHDKEQTEMDRQDGLIQERPAVLLLKHLHDLWPIGHTFMSTTEIVDDLIRTHPEHWGAHSPYGKALTATRLGRMLGESYRLHSTRPGGRGPRGYTREAMENIWTRLRVGTPLPEPGAPGGPGAPGVQDALPTDEEATP